MDRYKNKIMYSSEIHIAYQISFDYHGKRLKY